MKHASAAATRSVFMFIGLVEESSVLRRIGPYFLYLLLFFLAGRPVVAQSDGPPGVFVQAIPHHDLEFGVAIQEQGPVTRVATDQAIGKFEIWAQLPPNKQVTITIHPPEYLENGSDNVPYQLRAAYNVHSDDPSTATEISGLTATITPQAEETYDHPPPPFPEASAYVYVYGTATVEDQPSGIYSGTITLEAEMTN